MVNVCTCRWGSTLLARTVGASNRHGRLLWTLAGRQHTVPAQPRWRHPVSQQTAWTTLDYAAALALGCMVSGRTSVRYRFGSPFSSKSLCLWTLSELWLCLSLPTETLKWLSSLPVLMQESFWWWQRMDRYIISLLPHLHTTFSLSLISLTVSVDVKHHVCLLTLRPRFGHRHQNDSFCSPHSVQPLAKTCRQTHRQSNSFCSPHSVQPLAKTCSQTHRQSDTQADARWVGDPLPFSHNSWRTPPEYQTTLE